MDPGTRLVVVAIGFIAGMCILTTLFTHKHLTVNKRSELIGVEIKRKMCYPEVCGQQCYNNYYMNSWCENFTCYCDNDCQRHRMLYPWDDAARTCANICNLKHGPCTGSGCANDTYWANSTRTEYELYRNTSTWLYHPSNVRHVTEYYFFNSDVCFCYNNETGANEWEPSTTPLPSADSWNSSQPEWKFWLLLNNGNDNTPEKSPPVSHGSGEKSLKSSHESESSSDSETFSDVKEPSSEEPTFYEKDSQKSESSSVESTTYATNLQESESSSVESTTYATNVQESESSSVESTPYETNLQESESSYFDSTIYETNSRETENILGSDSEENIGTGRDSAKSSYSRHDSTYLNDGGMADSSNSQYPLGRFQNQREPGSSERYKVNFRKLFREDLRKSFGRRSKSNKKSKKPSKMDSQNSFKKKMKKTLKKIFKKKQQNKKFYKKIKYSDFY